KKPQPCGRGRNRGRMCLMHSVSKHVRVLSAGSSNNVLQITTASLSPSIHINGVQLFRVVPFRQVSRVADGCDCAVTIAVIAVPVATSGPARQIDGIT